MKKRKDATKEAKRRSRLERREWCRACREWVGVPPTGRVKCPRCGGQDLVD